MGLRRMEAENAGVKSLLMVGNFLSAATGVWSVGEDLASHLTSEGWQVTATSRSRNRFLRPVDMIWTTWRYRQRYRVAHIDVYSGPSFLWAEAVALFLRAMGKPYVLTLHGGNLPEFSKRKRKRVERLLRSAAAVTTPSRFLLEQMKVYSDNIYLIPNPLDLARYPFRLRKHPSPKLIWLRAFHTIYNPVMASTVIAQLQNFAGISLIMAGPDKKDSSLQATKDLAEKLKVADKISFVGPVQKRNVPSLLNQGDIFINTTNIDNMPVSVMEAMSCGLCIVSTNVGGIPYFLEDQKEALLVPPADPEAMAAAVRRIFTDPGLAEKLSSNARKKAEAFDWSVVIPKWESLLKSVSMHEETAKINYE